MSAMFPLVVAADPYDALLAIYVPLDEPEHIRKLRKRLMKANEVAASKVSNSEGHCPRAVREYEEIVAVASAHKYRLLNLDTLQPAVRLCLRLMQTATEYDQLGGLHADG
jgi:hypothetical protein